MQDTSKETPKTSGKYVPPQMRRAHGGQPVVTSSGTSRLQRGKKTAPNVHSQEDFPTLGSVADPGYLTLLSAIKFQCISLLTAQN